MATIHISGLDLTVTEETVYHDFIPFGDIVRIQLPRDPKSKDPHRGFAFVEYEADEDAEAAIDNMHLAQINGRTIRVSTSKAPKETFDIQNSKVAVWDQEEWMQHHTDVTGRETLQASGTPSDQPMQDAMQGLEAAGPEE
ncbi:uncharacterized protein V1518DRAFT_419863 [Limtongia smithiae]|uniref:uncharacterized protein n=1 Tax=Limtongia smithiae TaxID=1125753 RepID=UPI0034CDAE9C